MKKIAAEAFEDASRPEGGHAVILLVGLGDLSDSPTFRLRPVDAGLAADHRNLWTGHSVSPLATRQTDRGTEFVVGPDIVNNPLLLAGTAVAIEIPEAMVRGEFLWPNVTPLAQPKRRHMVSTRRPREPEAEKPPLKLVIELDPVASAGLGPILAGEIVDPSTTTEATLDRPAVDADAGPEAGATAVDANAPMPDAATEPVRLPPSLGTLNGARAAFNGARADGPPPRSSKVVWSMAAAMSALGVSALLLGTSIWNRGSVELAPAVSAPISSPASEVAAASENAPEKVTQDFVATVAEPAPVAPAPEPVNCDVPQIATEPLDGGRMRVRFASPCRSGQEFKLAYGGAEFAHRLNETGAFDDVIDCFAARTSTVDVVFQDGKTRTVPVTAKDLDRVTKIAVFWQAPVNLDLHLFEYAAKFGQKGHIWTKTPSDAATAQEAVLSDHRGHGFISTTGDAAADSRNVEVYTLFHHSEQSSGLVTMALDHATRGEKPDGATCSGGVLAEIPFQISVLDRRGQISRQAGILAAAECGKPLDASTRFNDSILTPLKIGK